MKRSRNYVVWNMSLDSDTCDRLLRIKHVFERIEKRNLTRSYVVREILKLYEASLPKDNVTN